MVTNPTLATPAENVLSAPAIGDKMLSNKQRTFMLTVRQALIMLLGALEDYLDMERSIIPKHKRMV